MKLFLPILLSGMVLTLTFSCTMDNKPQEITAEYILGKADYQAISYGGYRQTTRDSQPSIPELKADMKILSAMGIKVLRTYNTQKYKQAENLLAAIQELIEEDPNFEMYVMLGVWIDCKNAWTELPSDHEVEDEIENAKEIQTAIELATEYPNIVKVIAVGNEAMVKWAAEYYVQANVILKWVNHLQGLKETGGLPENLWITSSDNFASWGGGGAEYHTEDLTKLIEAVDFISMHTYPMHDTHYNPEFWGVEENEVNLSDLEKIEKAMERAKDYAVTQYENVSQYVQSLGIDKDIHIGETGWTSFSNELFGEEGSKAADEYKEALYYQKIREWTNKEGLTCFYFEAFDEKWKDANNPEGSENYFGLFTVEGQAKYALWDLVDQGVFEGLTRGPESPPISKTYKGDKSALQKAVKLPPRKMPLVTQ